MLDIGKILRNKKSRRILSIGGSARPSSRINGNEEYCIAIFCKGVLIRRKRRHANKAKEMKLNIRNYSRNMGVSVLVGQLH